MNILRDLHQGELRIHQKIGRAKDALFVDIVLQTLARLLPEEFGEVRGADADALRDIVQIDFFPVVLTHVIFCPLHMAGSVRFFQFLLYADGQLLDSPVAVVKEMGRILCAVTLLDVVTAQTITLLR